MSPRQLWAIALTSWCACVVLGLAVGPPLTGDEAAYGLLARGTEQAWLYRPVGLVALAKLGIALGGSDLAMRITSAIISPLLVVAAGTLGKRLSPWTGGAMACVVAGSHQFVLRGPELLNDIPATTCLVYALVILVDELPREGGPRWRLVWAAPLAAAAFYLRYGSAPVLAIIAVAALIAWPRAVLTRRGLATAGALALLLAPFFLYSIHATGSLTRILALSGEVSGRKYIGHGLASYLRTNAVKFYGFLAGPAVIAGVVALFKPPPEKRIAYFLAGVALGQVAVIGSLAHGSTRFIFVAIICMSVLGIDAAGRILPRLAVSLFLVLGCAIMLAVMVPFERTIATSDGLDDTIAAARAIRDDAAGRPCTVIARATPQLMWYAGCEAYKIDDATTSISLDPARRWYAASAPRRPIDPMHLAAMTGARVEVLAPSAWRVIPR